MKNLILSIFLSLFSIAVLSQNLPNYWVPTSGTNTYSVNITSFGSSYNNKILYVRFTNANTSTATINVNSLGVIPIRKWDGLSWVTLSSGDISTDRDYRLSYDTTNGYFRIEILADAYQLGPSVMGVSTNVSGKITNIAAGSDGQVLRLTSGTLGFGALDLSDTDATTNQLPATNVSFSPTGGISNGNVQNALAEVDAEKTSLRWLDNEQTTSYTGALTDINKVVQMNSASALNFTVPPNSSVAYPIGTYLLVRQKGAGTVTIVEGSGVTVTEPAGGSMDTPGQGLSVTLHKTGTNTWDLENGSPVGGGGGGSVNSVSGTTNRITSTGGTDPVIDISATFEALLGKVASPLSQFAATTSAQLRSTLSDESGTGNSYFQGGDLGTPSAGVLTNATGLPAASVVVTPSGNISATDAGTAITELDTEKEPTANKATSFGTINNTLFPSVQAVNTQFSSVIGQGVLASRPAASSANTGYLYFATDTKALYRSNGTSYDVWSINSAVINVKDYGVVGDGVTNDGPALNTLIGTVSADATLFFPPGTYLINTNVAVNKRLYFTGQFPILTTTANISIITVTAAESKFNNLVFRGQGKATASRTAQFGLNINGVGRTMTTNCTFTDFPGGGFFFTNTYVSPAGIAGVVANCVFYSNKIGITSSTRGEYFAITGCTSNSDDTGIRLTGGNNLISNCNFNYDGVGLEIVSGTNNAHGVISNSNFNHCTTYGINAHDFTLGQTFSNIHSYESPLRIADCTGAKFFGGTLDCDVYTFSNATALVFEGTTFGTGYSPTVSLSGTNSISYLNCKNLDGRLAIDPATFTNTYASNYVYGTVQTTDATTLNTVLAPLVANTFGKWRLEVVAKITSATNINDGLAAEMVAATKMTAAASGALEGSVTQLFTPIKSASMTLSTATMDVSSDNLRAVFTGLASTTIKWDYRLTPLVN